MALCRDDLATVVPVLWYEVPDTRPPVPYATPFISRNWELDRSDAILGERKATRRWTQASPPTEVNGEGLCGTREQWERGYSILDPIAPINPTTERQCCCGRGTLIADAAYSIGIGVEVLINKQIAEGGLTLNGTALQFLSHVLHASGGLVLSGQAVQTAGGGTTNECGAWPGSPLVWNLQGAGFGNGTCDCSPLNEIRPLNWAIGCNWISPEFAWCGRLGQWSLFWWQPPDNFFQLSFRSRAVGGSSSITHAAYNGGGDTWATLGPNTLNRVFSGAHCTWPDTVTLIRAGAPPNIQQDAEGGLLLSGIGLQLQDTAQIAAGGLVLSGLAGQELSVPLAPSLTCDASEVIALGTTYGPFTAPAGVFHWFKMPTISGRHAFRLTLHSWTALGSIAEVVLSGSSCATATIVATASRTSPGTACTAPLLAVNSHWLRILYNASGVNTASYSIRVDPGLC